MKLKANDSLGDDLVELIDSRGRPLAVVPAAEAHRQSLPHRSVLLLFFDRDGRLLLQKRPKDSPAYPDRWDNVARAHLRPGEAAQDAARRLAETHMPDVPVQVNLHTTMQPSPGTGFEAVAVFRCQVMIPREKERDILAVSREELAALAVDLRELFAPGVIHVFESSGIFLEDKPEKAD